MDTDNERSDARKSTLVSGRISAGLGEGKFFTQLPWVRRQLAEKLGIDPYPGTLNLLLSNAEDQRRLAELRRVPGVQILPEGEGFCAGTCYRVILREGVEGAAVFPEVAGYPADKLEIISGVNLKQALGVRDGDEISVIVEA